MAVGAAPARPRRRAFAIVMLALAAVVGFIAVRSLGASTVYFKTADEAVADKASLGTRRFRIEGTVLDGTVRASGKVTRFAIAEKGTRVEVVHDGDPPELFQPGIPVVLEGHWAGDHFASDRIMVKHSEQYKEKNPSRVKDYQQ
ncbi:MAG TPA: cytochrome c maturation protein CcmE [Acidimicrobiales bacterium]|nr:cytochrome c maturation protein CcmE [Acidimicrobiales bacterium]